MLLKSETWTSNLFEISNGTLTTNPDHSPAHSLVRDIDKTLTLLMPGYFCSWRHGWLFKEPFSCSCYHSSEKSNTPHRWRFFRLRSVPRYAWNSLEARKSQPQIHGNQLYTIKNYSVLNTRLVDYDTQYTYTQCDLMPKTSAPLHSDSFQTSAAFFPCANFLFLPSITTVHSSKQLQNGHHILSIRKTLLIHCRLLLNFIYIWG